MVGSNDVKDVTINNLTEKIEMLKAQMQNFKI
jgi:hypothetical protein